MAAATLTDRTPQERIAAGTFLEWLAATRAALQGGHGTQVPCGDCVGCCVSSYFIPVRPEDKRALELIPDAWLARSPSVAGGQWVIGYLEDGACPMLASGKCTIYADRPQTCRDYDCRVFAAAGIDAGEDKPVINRRVHAWQFTYPTLADRAAHDAVQRAAAFIRDKKASFPGGRAPTSPTGIAVLAVKVYSIFLDPQSLPRSDTDVALAIIAASRAFDGSK